MDCRHELKSAIIRQLQSTSIQAHSLKDLENIYETHEKNPNSILLNGLAGAIFTIKEPSSAVPLLTKMLENKNQLIAVEAGAALAVLESRLGINQLKTIHAPLTNSGIEFFLAKAALILLNEPLTADLEKKGSVFLDLENLIKKCQSR